MSTNNQPCFLEMNEQRKRNEGCDVIIGIDNKIFPCHRAVLSSWSSYFKAMLNGNFVESESNLITIREVDREAFGEILDAMYTGKITITRQNACRLLKACSFLGLHEFQKSCVTFAEENRFVEHLIELCLYADLLKEKKLFLEMVKHIAENFIKLSSNYDFSTLPASIFDAILSQATLDRSGHVVLLEIVKWSKKNSDDSPDLVFEKLLKTAKLTTISSSLVGKFLFSTENSTNIEKVIDEMSDGCDSKETLEITGVGKPTMKVYLKAATQKEGEPDNFISLAYAPENEKKWILADVFNSSFDNLKSVCIGRQQYFLSYGKNESVKDICRFWMVEDGKSTVLNNPPLVRQQFELVELNGIIFLYYPVVQKDIKQVYFYYSELDKWVTAPTLEHTISGAGFVGHGYFLSLFGGALGPEFSKFSHKVLCWDTRCSKWNVTDGGNNLRFYNGAACAFNGYIYASGSSFSTGFQSQFLRSTIPTNSILNLYEMNSMCRERGRNHTLTVFNGEIYAIDNNLEIPFSFVEKHSGEPNDEWKEISSLPKKVVAGKDIFYTNNVTATVVTTY